MRCLVTGGTGFIGGHVCEKLYNEGHEVLAYDLLPPSDELPSGIGYMRGDILNKDELRVAMNNKDIVFHLAAMPNTIHCVNEPVAATKVNCLGTTKVFDTARKMGVDRVVVGGSSLVSGLMCDGVDVELIECRNSYHIYVTTKLFQEMIARDFHDMYGLDYTVLRYGIGYGPRMTPGVVADIFIEKALDGQPLTVHGSGQQWRQYTYVEDMAEGHLAVLSEKAKNKTYNLVKEQRVRIIDMAKMISRHTGAEIEKVDSRSHDLKVKMIHATKIKKDLGWEATTTLEKGMAKTIAWYVENRGDNSG